MRRLVVLGIMLAAILGASQFASAGIQLASDDPVYGNSWATGYIASGPIDTLEVSPADAFKEPWLEFPKEYSDYVISSSGGVVLAAFSTQQTSLSYLIWFPGAPETADLNLNMKTYYGGELVDNINWHWDSEAGTLGGVVSLSKGWTSTPVVPEPASLAIWSLAAGGLSLAAGFRSLRRRKFNEGGENAARPTWSDESRQGILRVIESGRRR